ncbi:trigger factor [Haloglycomyces albus]|uniref:trigger factor n=1 Tax=Haloglycomyces albus TaxID=526067 RepID=UPI00046CB275|nr:trigger factor [Haloglycomyces albus]
MKSTVETLNPTRVRLTVEVPFDDLAPYIDEAYKQVGQQVRVPGFRPGKAPKAVIDQRVGRESVYAQAMDPAIQANLSTAVSEKELNLLGRPELVEVNPIETDKPLEFVVEADVAPDFELPNFADLKVNVEAGKVTEEDIDSDLEQQRLRFSSLTTVDRPADNGDFVVIDLKATRDGEEVEGGSVSGMSHEVGSGNLLDGLDEALVGMKAGDEKRIQSSLVAGEEAGSEADIDISVEKVKERELPELNDEFAEMSASVDTLEELREDTRKRLTDQAENDVRTEAREKVLEALLADLDLPLPQGTVDSEIEHTKNHLNEQVGQMGGMEVYLQQIGKTEEEFDADLKQDVEQNLKQSIVLGRIAGEKEVEPNGDMILSEAARMAQMNGVAQDKFPEFIEQLRSSGQLQQIAVQARQKMALEKVVEEATVVDSDGNTLDKVALFGESPEEQSSDEAEGESAEAETK